MLSGTLRIRNNVYYAIIYWQNEEKKQEQFPFSTGIKVNGKKEEKEANTILMEARVNFDPNNIKKMKEKYLKRKARKNIIRNTEIMNLSVYEFFEWALNIYLLKNPSLSIVTKNGYKNEVKKMKNYALFKSISFAELTKKDIEHYLEYLFIIEKLASSTIAKIRVVLGTLYKVAIQRELVEYNLIYKTEPIKVKKTKKKALSKEKAKIFLEALENSEYKLEFYLLIFLGLRKSELLGITIDNINFEEKSLYLEQSLIWDSENKIYVVNREMKSPLAHRKFPLIPILTDFLTERIDRIKEDKIFFGNTYGIDKKLNFNAEGYLCIDREGKILRKFKLNYELDKILKKIGLEHLSIHELRHTCATLMYSEGVDLKKIQYWLGHSNISTTANIYAHYDNSKNFEVIGKLEKALEKNID